MTDDGTGMPALGATIQRGNGTAGIQERVSAQGGDLRLVPARPRSVVWSPDLAPVVDALSAVPDRVLSAREFDVLGGLVEGRTLEQIAARTHLSPKTVSNYQTQTQTQTRIRQRMGLATAVELLHCAREHRLFMP